jgi:hypothetical protein
LATSNFANNQSSGLGSANSPTLRWGRRRIERPNLLVDQPCRLGSTMQCLEVDVAGQGRSPEAALANLTEAVTLNLAEFDDPDAQIAATPLVTSLEVSGAA